MLFRAWACPPHVPGYSEAPFLARGVARGVGNKAARAGLSGGVVHRLFAACETKSGPTRKPPPPSGAAAIGGSPAAQVATLDDAVCAGFRMPAWRPTQPLRRPASEKRQGTKSRWVGHWLAATAMGI
jgi:hypothetical protein